MKKALFIFLLWGACSLRERRANEYSKFSSDSYQAAFQRLDVERVTLQPVQKTERLDAQQKQNFYVESVNPNVPNSAGQFVKDKDGKIYALALKPKVVGSVTLISRSCPSGQSPVQHVPYFLLYEGVTGTKTIEYEIKEVHTQYKPRSPCIAPPSMQRNPDAVEPQAPDSPK